ncbi:MAG: cobyrinate a,c-diamide synthase [Panacagrimonas sp.]
MSSCRTLLVSAPASGQGKTTVTAALARRARRQGLGVRVFKTGPDFIDPSLLEVASGAPVQQLDLWMVGPQACRRLLAEAAQTADLILIEGVMGLFDGAPSSADLAEAFGVPVLAVIDGSAMAQTFGALAQGLARYRESLQVFGVLANRVGSQRHAQMLNDSLRAPLQFVGALPRDPAFQLPERHLGLVLASELSDLDQRIDAAAHALGDAVRFDTIPATEFERPAPAHMPLRLRGLRIAVARDEAFAFHYPANLDSLQAMGATLAFFSPLHDPALPDADALWLPGGYPELHARWISDNTPMRDSIHAHHAAGKPLLAECGGMMSLFEALSDHHGTEHSMFGLLPGRCAMQAGLQGLGMQSVAFEAGELRGHSFHHSRAQTLLEPARVASNPNGGATTEAVYQLGRLTASYVHFYFASNPAATAALFSR